MQRDAGKLSSLFLKSPYGSPAEVQTTARRLDSTQEMLLGQIDAGEPLSPTYPYPVGVWKLGDEVRFVLRGGVEGVGELNFDII